MHGRDTGGIMDDTLLRDIKFNCDVSDARYWGYFSICGLLIRYRDLYRSEKGLAFRAEIRSDAIGAWIQAKESAWPALERQTFRSLTLNGKSYDPFDLDGINRLLVPQGLIYGAGYGMYMKPTFFLASLVAVREVDGLTVYTSDAELVRDLFTSAGMLQGTSILLRLEPLSMLLMSKFSSLDPRKAAALDDAFVHTASITSRSWTAASKSASRAWRCATPKWSSAMNMPRRGNRRLNGRTSSKPSETARRNSMSVP